jgi:hypothetical protein
MDEEGNRLRNESMGTNYTFRDKHGRLITSTEGGLLTEEEFDRSHERTTDIPHLNYEASKAIFQQHY